MGLIIPKDYNPFLSLRQTQKAVKIIKDVFEIELSKLLNLERVSAPLFVYKDSGLNDDLNGTETPVSFDFDGRRAEIVHSLAKWKRYALKKYGFEPHRGIYADMNAIRADEEVDNFHSIYVDQWDWEVVINREDRNIAFLKETVRKIVCAIHDTWEILNKTYSKAQTSFTHDNDVFFISSQELEDMFPSLTPKERENEITKAHPIVFIMQIGDKLKSGKPHDGRAPDYDDWQLNGDLIYRFEPLDTSIEIMSMGIRVDEKSMAQQLKKAGAEERRNLPFHRELLAGNMPLTVGGGIGQSRLCMLLLQKAHIGEVQVSLWPDEMREICENNNMKLL
ncbi:MAG: aspartate--ammonia ligase [Clostridia bacterium]|nr:aspartate--ammonia ligase [Clostridia bacterium]